MLPSGTRIERHPVRNTMIAVGIGTIALLVIVCLVFR